MATRPRMRRRPEEGVARDRRWLHPCCMIHPWLIRAATSSDLDDLVSLTGSRDRVQVRLQAAERGDDSMLRAGVSSQGVAVESIRWRNGCDLPHPWVYVGHVAAEMRRQGVGRGVVKAAEAVSRRRGADHLSLDVDTDDDAA